MSTTALRVTQPRVIKSEWIKLRSLRSTVYTLVASVGMTIGLGVLIATATVAQWDSMRPAAQARFDALDFSLRGVFLAQLAIGTLGVMLITGEYTTGLIRASLGAVPRRLPVFWAKFTVFGAVGTVISIASAFVAFFVTQAILSTKHLQVSLSDPGVIRAVCGAGLYLGAVGLLGMGLGFLVRNTAGAIASLVGILLILPVLAEVLPSRWSADVTPYIPGNAGQALMTLHPDANTLAPWTGFGVFLGYVAVIAALAAVLLRKRDA